MNLRGRINPAAHRVEIDRAEMAGGSVGVTVAGALDSSGTEPRLNGSLSGTPMPASVLKQMWPPTVNAKVRAWVMKHLLAGNVERIAMWVNAPVNTLALELPVVGELGQSRIWIWRRAAD